MYKVNAPLPQIAIDAVASIKQYIEDHPTNRTRIAELTMQTCVGRNMLHVAFREIEGKTIVRFQLEKRMEHAGWLLIERRLTIQQVARYCGYKKHTNFTSDFKKVYRMPPKLWLKLHITKY